MKLGIGDRLREERNRLGLNQTEAAKAAGIGFSTYQTYEAGERCPNAEALASWAGSGFDILYVVTGTRNNSALSGEQTALLGLYGQIDERLRPAVQASLQALAQTKL
ncbi:helix-turn-helix domain-containing protein [Aquitalea sp. ASV11]|uniref:helix-turn-helix domain-containing protein n=1 Tax=Aquitalea sp. ASV11 TaxID=2795103 RepID=UPI0018ED2658|nr:helix-turn-helix transcriptional regulator [Aquitalea sp. ASV11]